jgi:hypothetical protein
MKNTITVEVIIPTARANLLSFILFIIAFVLVSIPYILIWGRVSFLEGFRSFFSLWIFPVVIAGAGLHELIHAVTFSVFCRRGFRAIRFGMKWKHLTPYVHCQEELSTSAYKAGTVMPGLVMGILPLGASLITGNAWWLTFGLFFTAGASGDFLSLYRLTRIKNVVGVIDHPDELGFIVIRQEGD